MNIVQVAISSRPLWTDLQNELCDCMSLTQLACQPLWQVMAGAWLPLLHELIAIMLFTQMIDLIITLDFPVHPGFAC